jgi:cellulose synthase/poly-beta-1,6-N-acetylglucosamine synthase-like glycosyltransferase
MHALILWASVLLTGALAAFSVYLLIVTTAAVYFRSRRNHTPRPEWGGKFFIVIPAHDEAALITDTVSSLRSTLAESGFPFSVWVVADNCSDNTADLASAAGARVLRRTDPARAGKGFALAFFFDQLLSMPDVNDDDAAVVIDADTRADPQLLRAFAYRLSERWDWLQGVSGIANRQASWRTRLMSCAFALINGTWLMGQDALGHSVSLRGNGMCFTVGGLRKAPWQAFGLDESIEYSWTLRLGGKQARFVPDAKVFSEIAFTNPSAVRMQRQRWESGRKSVRYQFTQRVLKTGSLGLGEKILCLLELYMPTLTKLASFVAIAAALTWLAISPNQPGFLILGTTHLAIIAILISYLLSPYWLGLLPWQYALYLLYSPMYMLWKVDLLFRKPPTVWIRTAREGRVQ